MISVLISSESRYKFERDKIRQKIKGLLSAAGLVDVEVSIAVVGTRKIRSLNKSFRKLDEPTDVLSFPQDGVRDPDGTLRLGDIVVCYPLCRQEASKENKMIYEKMNELVEHGLRHLLGENHE